MKFTLKQPQAPFLQNIAMFPFAIASPKAVEKWGTDYGKHPVGTGAFKFVEWKPNQEVVLEANPRLLGKKASVKRAVVRNIKDNSQRVAALKAGEVHGIEGINPDDLKVLKADSNLQVLLRPTNTTGYVAFNYKVKEFQDKRVRAGDRARDQQEGDRRRALRRHRPRGDPVPAPAALGLQQGD